MTSFIDQHPGIAYGVIIAVTVIVSPWLQKLIGRLALRWAIKSENVIDDLIVDSLRPFRFIYALPVGLAFFLANWAEPYVYEAQLISGLLLILVVVESTIKLLGALAAVVRHKSGDKGASSTGYIDLLKILVVVGGVAFAAAIYIDTDFVTLIGGLGAATAVLGFIFQDTLHAIVAGIKIASWNHIREGDWISVPDFDADGTVESIGLYDIKVRNFDLTVSLVPTHKILEVATTNYREMQKHARARRIQEKVLIDIETIRICDRPLLEKLEKIELISDVVAEKMETLSGFNDQVDDPGCAASVSTNFELFRIYIDRYLRSRDDLHQKQQFILVRALAPTANGFPLDIFAYARNTDLIGFSDTQTSIFAHLSAMVGLFDLILYQIHDQ